MILAKPEPRKKVKARGHRLERRVIKAVREKCVQRDGYCRLHLDAFASGIGMAGCEGVSEWAHLGDKKRFKTRGQAPEVRHTTAGSLMLCTKHHDDYDEGRMDIIGTDANRSLCFVRRGHE